MMLKHTTHLRWPQRLSNRFGRPFLLMTVLSAISFMAPFSANAKEADAGAFLVNVYGRDTLDLSGDWQYIVDPMREGLRVPRKNIRNFAKDEVAKGNRLIEYEWDSSPVMQVPGDWNTQVSELGWYEGLVWYRKRVTMSSKQLKPGKRYFVYFEGANYSKTVFLNNVELGSHEGGFSPFSFEITDQLIEGDNSLVVAVDNARRAHQIPSLKYDWFNYGGLTRPVHIVELPATYIHDYRAWLGDDGKVHVTVGLDGKGRDDTEVSLSIPELGIDVAKPALNGKVNFSLSIDNLQRWSPQAPKLYELSLSTGEDTVAEKIGFRTISVDGTKIVLNGEPVFLKGISVHEEVLGANGGRGLTWESARELLKLVKELGSNYVRLAHYPHSEKMVRLADEMGLLVWSEVPLWQEIEFSDPRTLALAKQMQTENVRRDFNRASIVIWSIANETPQTEQRLKFLRKLIDHTRELDDTRLISSALDKNKSEGDQFTVEDPLGQYLDVFSVNTYEGWYGNRMPAQIADTSWGSAYQKPMIFSEFGAGAKYGLRSEGRERWTEEYQADVYVQTLKLAERTPLLQGMSPWILKDFKSPRRYHGRIQEYWNRKGVVDERGNKKMAFKILQEWFENRKQPDSAQK